MTPSRSLFSRHNLRCTRQRLALYDTLRICTSHPTAEELHRMVRPAVGRLSLATVYNTLDRLCEAGLCRRLPTGTGSCRYDADMTEHLHTKDRDTGEIRDVPADLSRQLVERMPRTILARIERHMGVRIAGVSVQLLVHRAEPRG